MITSDIIENDKFSITSYAIHFLTSQRVSDKLPSKSITTLFSPQWTFLVVTLTIYLFLPNYFPRKYQFPHEVYDQVLFSQWNYFFCRHVQLVTSEWQNSELGSFSIGYVHITSEPTDNQVSSSSPVGTIPLPLCPVHHL